MSMSFTRVIENFICEHCGAQVIGDGYTNHCSECLWSKHVDNDPGDRAALCGGAMEPVGIEGSSPEYRIVHRCLKCGVERRVITSGDDSAEHLVALAKKGGVA